VVLVVLVAAQARRAEVLPPPAFGVLVLLAGLGLPVTLALAWRAGRRAGIEGSDPASDRVARAAAWVLTAVGVAATGAGAVVAWESLGAPEREPLLPFDTMGTGTRREAARLRVAFLRLGQPSGGVTPAYLAHGLTGGVIEALDRTQPIDVVPRAAVEALAEGRVDTTALMAGLGVGTRVEGQLSGDGGRIRVVFHLVDARTGDTVSTRTVEGEAGRPLRLQDTLTAEVVAALEEHLGVGLRRDPPPPGATERAWELVRRAEALIDRVVGHPRDPDSIAAHAALDRADSLLAAAESAAPGWITPVFRRGWLELARARHSEGPPGALESTPLLRGLGHAERALVLRPGDRPAALELRGVLRQSLAGAMPPGGGRSRMLRLARQDLSEAVEARPGMARAWGALGAVLRLEGARASAERAARRALLENPYADGAAETHYLLFRAALATGRRRSAGEWCDDGRARFPADPSLALCPLLLMAAADSIPPDPAAARVLAERAVAAVPPSDTARLRARADLQLAKVFARAGRPDSAEACIRRAHGPRFRRWLAYDEAHARLLLDQPDSALVLLGIAADEAPDRAREWPRDDWLRDLWRDPRFLRLVESAGN
ncbi:MAG: hypothetical protein GWM90_29270, partial [Gemmatimonadetes bacterium]|nr:hypothetical protein [Gemmatimonadota bacterium]NIQ59140.1 hypothetical protein [Gemmatimonadota bacterium]NIU79344.1 hypothetical protein [Gammaproteobacteria bacterium]NIX48012.1 hypothetical protein [Gemmatimonadota bacterium]NIY12383.1 hypothetical protein [Gemmatimonadota bacterium]